MPSVIAQLFQKNTPVGKTASLARKDHSTDAPQFDVALKKVQQKEPTTETPSVKPASKPAKSTKARKSGTETSQDELNTAESPEKTKSSQAKRQSSEKSSDEVTDTDAPDAKEAESAKNSAPTQDDKTELPAMVSTDPVIQVVMAETAQVNTTVTVESGIAGTAKAPVVVKPVKVDGANADTMKTQATDDTAPQQQASTPNVQAIAQRQEQAAQDEAQGQPKSDPQAVARHADQSVPSQAPADESPKPVKPTAHAAAQKLDDLAQAMAMQTDPALTPDATDAKSAAQGLQKVLQASSPDASDIKTPNAPQQTTINAPQPAPPPEVRFAEVNHPKIVTGMKTELLPQGGTMQIRLDPPEIGALLVSVQMHDGVLSASFQTSSDDATKLLSHSLSQLKTALESQGVSVEKLHVQQAPRDQQSSNDDQQQQGGSEQQNSAWQEQQRKQMLQRMWRRIALGSDPLDLVA